jgi:hypothetical protein
VHIPELEQDLQILGQPISIPFRPLEQKACAESKGADPKSQNNAKKPFPYLKTTKMRFSPLRIVTGKSQREVPLAPKIAQKTGATTPSQEIPCLFGELARKQH